MVSRRTGARGVPKFNPASGSLPRTTSAGEIACTSPRVGVRDLARNLGLLTAALLASVSVGSVAAHGRNNECRHGVGGGGAMRGEIGRGDPRPRGAAPPPLSAGPPPPPPPPRRPGPGPPRGPPPRAGRVSNRPPPHPPP